MADTGFRIEHDSMGEMRVPQDAYYGAQTQRAVENFPIKSARSVAHDRAGKSGSGEINLSDAHDRSGG